MKYEDIIMSYRTNKSYVEITQEDTVLLKTNTLGVLEAMRHEPSLQSEALFH